MRSSKCCSYLVASATAPRQRWRSLSCASFVSRVQHRAHQPNAHPPQHLLQVGIELIDHGGGKFDRVRMASASGPSDMQVEVEYDEEACVVSTIAGSREPAFTDGLGPMASFRGPLGIACDGEGALIVVDSDNRRVRKIKVGRGGSRCLCTLLRAAGSPDASAVTPGNLSRPSGLPLRAPSGVIAPRAARASPPFRRPGT